MPVYFSLIFAAMAKMPLKKSFGVSIHLFGFRLAYMLPL